MFKPVSNKVDFPKMEEDILKFWEENDICNKSIDQRPADNEYVFYDGPPFATGLPHFGHFVPGTIKDAVIYAAASAGSSYGQDLSDWQIVEYPKPLTTMEKIMETFGGSSAKVFAGTPLEDVEEAFTGWKNTESGKVYARIPYEIEIR